jgi:hypothetical protein
VDDSRDLSVGAPRLYVMTIISARGRKSRTAEPDLDFVVSEGELLPHWLPKFAPAHSLVDNVFSVARPLW